MRISDIISMCLGNLFRRKMRTLLTVIGVVVGTCAIVVMISIGIGMNESQEAMLAQMGDLTVINVYNWNSGGSGEQLVLNDEAVAKIQAIDQVDVATPIYYPRNLNARIYGGKKEKYYMYAYNVVGIYKSAMEKMGYTLQEGSFPGENSEPFTVLAGQYAAYEFRKANKKYADMIDPYPDAQGNVKDPYVNMLRDPMILKTEKMEEDSPDSTVVTQELKVSGILAEDWNKGYETSRGIIMDINDLKKLEKDYMKANKIKESDSDNKGYNDVTVKVNSIDDVEAVEEAIQAMGFETNSMESIRKPMQEAARRQQMVLGGLGAISLLVAAIGITNTMIMSIYERTREIGVMKVLGCFVRNIRTVFLMEAGLIGFLGGILGIGISYLISFIMNYVSMNGLMANENSGGFGFGMMGMFGGGGASGMPISVIPGWLVILALIFATLIGLISGFYPANRAVKISALEAIKHE